MSLLLHIGTQLAIDSYGIPETRSRRVTSGDVEIAFFSHLRSHLGLRLDRLFFDFDSDFDFFAIHDLFLLSLGPTILRRTGKFNGKMGYIVDNQWSSMSDARRGANGGSNDLLNVYQRLGKPRCDIYAAVQGQRVHLLRIGLEFACQKKKERFIC